MPARNSEIFAFPTGVRLPPSHPGLTLSAELNARGMTIEGLAIRLHARAEELSAIANGEARISPEIALRLGRFFGTGAVFWMNLQGNIDLALTEREIGARIVMEVEAA